MNVWRLPPERADEAADILLDVFPDFPGSSTLDREHERRVARLLHERTIESGLANGRVDVWGDPPVGVAIWLLRPALVGQEHTAVSRPSSRTVLPAEVIEPVERFEAAMRRLRAVARPDRHVYLDMLAVLPAHRRHGIATALLKVGHGWADDLGLPVALDTDTDENVAFYERRGYVVIAREPLPDSDRDLVAMRRRDAGAAQGSIRGGRPR